MFFTLSIIFFLNLNNPAPIIGFKDLEPRLQNPNNDTVYIINFWATWCKPCVEELPYFEEITHEFKDQKIKVLLVSLDFKSKRESALIPFINKNKIKSEVVLLYEPDANSWISKVDSTWSGAIPATLFLKKDKRKFFGNSFEKEELFNEIKLFNN